MHFRSVCSGDSLVRFDTSLPNPISINQQMADELGAIKARLALWCCHSSDDSTRALYESPHRIAFVAVAISEECNMKPRLCLLVAGIALLRPVVAHFWPPAHPFHSAPNVQPATFYANVLPEIPHQEQQAHTFPPNRFWKSDSVFLFRPFMTSAWNAGPEQRMQIPNPFMERLLSSPYRRLRLEGFGARKRRARGMRGEINVKWSVMPIWERDEPEIKPQNEATLPQLSQELVSRPRHWPKMIPIHPMPPNEQQAWNQGNYNRV